MSGYSSGNISEKGSARINETKKRDECVSFMLMVREKKTIDFKNSISYTYKSDLVRKIK